MEESFFSITRLPGRPLLAVSFTELFSYIPLLAVIDILIIGLTVPWILSLKKNSTSALAWSLVVIFLPILGFLLFLIFGYTYVDRPLRRKRRHRATYRKERPPTMGEWSDQSVDAHSLADIALQVGGFEPIPGNEITLYHETKQAHEEMLDAVSSAQHHIHLEYYILQSDPTGKQFFDLLTEKAKEGVEVRVIYDAIGSMFLRGQMIRPLCKAGGRCAAFLSVNPFRRRFQVNMRNHRKITLVDGRIAFMGGMNIGDEYLGKNKLYPVWRDAQLRLEGPAVEHVQRMFAEDWDFSCGERLDEEEYFPSPPPVGEVTVQLVDSGPDELINSYRELIFAALVSAKERIWIASPYFVPDLGILDALRLACRRGVDVRLLSPLTSDSWPAHHAGRYYWDDLLDVGMKIYEYRKGMMHAKTLIVDNDWAAVGSANMDNRSFRLNFEITCVMHSAELVMELEEAFCRDLDDSIEIDGKAFSGRPFSMRLMENACRLLSPIL